MVWIKRFLGSDEDCQTQTVFVRSSVLSTAELCSPFPLSLNFSVISGILLFITDELQVVARDEYTPGWSQRVRAGVSLAVRDHVESRPLILCRKYRSTRMATQNEHCPTGRSVVFAGGPPLPWDRISKWPNLSVSLLSICCWPDSLSLPYLFYEWETAF